MPLLDDLGLYLQDEGLGILGTDLFLGGIPLDAPDVVHQDNLTALAENTGFAPTSVHSIRGPAVRQPAIDLLVRGAPYDYTTPRVQAQRVSLALSAICNQQLSGAFYLWVRPLQSVYKRSQDDFARLILTCQFRLACDVVAFVVPSSAAHCRLQRTCARLERGPVDPKLFNLGI